VVAAFAKQIVDQATDSMKSISPSLPLDCFAFGSQ